MRILTNKFCVYTHDIDGVIFYVGKGKSYRPFDALSRSDVWKNHVQLNGGEFNVNIIRWYKKENAALSCERRLISKYKPNCNLCIFKSHQNKLSRYIISLGMTDKEFAKQIGVGPVTISHAKSGNIGRVTAKKIIDFSGGKLNYDDIYREFLNEIKTQNEQARKESTFQKAQSPGQ